MTWQQLAARHHYDLRARPDLPVTGEESIDAVVRELGRPLSPEETFNVRAGLPHDHQPEHVPRSTEPPSTESPESVFARLARERE